MNKQNNICFFNTTPFWGGGEKLHLEYALEFKKLNYNVCVVAKKDSPFFQESKEEGIKVYPLTVKTFSFLNRKKVLEARNFFRKNKINTVFISASPDLKIAAFAAKKAGVKNIIYLRGLAVSIKNTPLNRVLLTKTVTHIIANSEETKRQMVKNFRDPVLEKKVKVIYHGIDLSLFDKKFYETSPLNVKKEGVFVIGNAGRLTKQKGQYFLIEIAKNLRAKNLNFKILIAGAGEEEETIKQLIAVNNLQDYVILLGFVKNIEGFMKSLDVFALTSIWEGFGYVIVEAMAAKKPVVAFDITSNPEIITQNKTGFLIPQKNVEQFSEKIDLLLNDTNLARKMGADGRKKVEERFQLKTIILEIEMYLKLKNK